MLRYRDLTKEEVAFISDGCGKKGGWLDVPDFIFTASCDHHDVNYWIGGIESDRAKADRQFYEAMVLDTKLHSWYKRYWYRTLAWIYYKAVRFFAKPYFHYGAPQGQDELTKEMKDG